MARARAETAAVLIPPRPTLASLREAAAACRACELWKRGTQTVFGEGPGGARALFVGEQPGNDEDLAGPALRGPRRTLLDKALEEAGIDRARAYLTNVVKHFKWEPRGKRRIHEKPNALEIRACRPWLEAEIELVRPDVSSASGRPRPRRCSAAPSASASSAASWWRRRWRLRDGDRPPVLDPPRARRRDAPCRDRSLRRGPAPGRPAAVAALNRSDQAGDAAACEPVEQLAEQPADRGRAEGHGGEPSPDATSGLRVSLPLKMPTPSSVATDSAQDSGIASAPWASRYGTTGIELPIRNDTNITAFP